MGVSLAFYKRLLMVARPLLWRVWIVVEETTRMHVFLDPSLVWTSWKASEAQSTAYSNFWLANPENLHEAPQEKEFE